DSAVSRITEMSGSMVKNAPPAGAGAGSGGAALVAAALSAAVACSIAFKSSGDSSCAATWVATSKGAAPHHRRRVMQTSFVRVVGRAAQTANDGGDVLGATART